MINIGKSKEKCCEDLSLIENYAEAVADTTQTWDCHHKLGVRDGKTVTDELKAHNMYYNRPASELIFVTHSQHMKLHHDVQSKWHKEGGKACAAKLTFEQRSKAGKAKTFEQYSKAGKAGSHKSKVLAGKIGGKKAKGKLWWNNGVISKRSVECPGPNFVRGRLKRK